MKKRQGPFKIVLDESRDLPLSLSDLPDRNYDCPNYENCLKIAATLDWEDFSCRACIQEINPALLWQAKIALKKDKIAKELCKQIPAPLQENDDIDEVA